MPRVPTIGGQTVAPDALPGVRQNSVATGDLLGAGARQLGEMGNAATGLGVEIETIRQQQLAQANALRVDDALNQASEIALRLQHDKTEGFTSQTGYAALSRTSGMPLADEYAGKLKEQVAKIANGLANDDQKKIFGAKVNNVVTSFYGHALTHEATQQREYNLSVRDATVTNAREQLALNFTDPKNVEYQTNRIRAAIEGGQDENGVFVPGAAQMAGKSAAWARERADEHVSQAHEQAIKSALETGNVNLAMAYFKRYGQQMTAKDVLAVQGTLTREYDTRQGQVIGQQVFEQARPAIMPTDFDRLKFLVMGQESGGRDFGADGKILTSSAGAKGRMQVMDGTNKDPGFGVRPAKDDSVEERARVGNDYLGAMVKNYGGDLRKALAAYNAGPGAVDRALKEADQDVKAGAFRGQQPSGDYWLSKLPKETQDYVAKISERYAKGAGAPQKPTLEDMHREVDALVGPNASPTMVKTARETITQRYADAEKAVTQRKTEAVTAAQQEILANGGNFLALKPSTRAVLQQQAPDKVDELMNFADRIHKGEDRTNDAVYMRLSNPAYLRNLSEQDLFQFRRELAEADYKHFVNERQKAVTGQAGQTGPGDLNSSAIANALDQRLRELNIDPSPKSDGKEGDARVGAIRKFVDQQVLAAQRDAGKKFTDAETVAYIDKLASTSAELKGWFSTYRAPLLSTKVGDIPSATKDSIKAAYKKQGVDEPTDAQVLEAFLHLNTRKK